MDNPSIARALQRVEEAFTRKPALARHEDTPARAVWVGGLQSRLDLPGGGTLQADLPPVMGGDGAGVLPGWLMRAGLASCLVSAVTLRAACQGITLRRLEVQVQRVSDARGLLGCEPEVSAGPLSLRLAVAIDADGVDEATLRGLVAWADAHSPVSDALRQAMDLQLQVEIGVG